MPRPRDRNPSLSKTCLICRQKIINPFKLNDTKSNSNKQVPLKIDKQSIKNEDISSSPSSNLSHWKTLCLESLSMLFGLPANHPLIKIFTKGAIPPKEGDDSDTTLPPTHPEFPSEAKMCNRCFEDISQVHLILWQLSSLEKRLSLLQTLLFTRLLKNYENLPTPTIFSPLGLPDLQNNLSSLKYDDLVKILFEEIKSNKESWPKPTTISPERWKAACQIANLPSQNPNLPLNQSPPSSPHSPSSPPHLSPSEETQTTELISPELVKIEIDPLPSTALSSPSKIPPSPPSPPLPPKRLSRKPPKYLENPPSPSSPHSPDSSDEYIPPPKRISRGRPSKKSPPAPHPNKKPPKILSISSRYLCTSSPSTCTLTFPTKKSLSSHIRSLHPPSKPSPSPSSKICELCGITVPSKHLRKHFFLRHHGQGSFPCPLCSMDLHSSTDLSTHSSLHALHKSSHPFTCVVCSKLFTNSMDLRSHVASNHLSSGLKCDICGIMKPNEYLLQRHLKIHERAKDIVCSQCGKRFSTRGYLKYHEDHYHTNLGRKFPCEICGKEFMHEKNVARHLNSHKEEKAFKCGICGKGFNYSHLLKKHEEIHSGTKNYECEKCGKRFRQEQNLRQHYKSHREKNKKREGGGGGGRRRKGKDEEEGRVEEINYEIREEEVMEGEEEGEEMEVMLEMKGEFGGDGGTGVLEGDGVIEATIVPDVEGGMMRVGQEMGQFQSVQEIQFEAHPETSGEGGGDGNVMGIGGAGGHGQGGHQTATVVFLYEYQA